MDMDQVLRKQKNHNCTDDAKKLGSKTNNNQLYSISLNSPIHFLTVFTRTSTPYIDSLSLIIDISINMAASDTDGYWDIVVSSLQDLCNANESLTFDPIFDPAEKSLESLTDAELEALKDELKDHNLNIGTAKRIISTSQQNLQTLIAKAEEAQRKEQELAALPPRSLKSQVAGKIGRSTGKGKKNSTQKQGRIFWQSKYDSDEPVIVGSEVAFKLKSRHLEEWIQCEITKIIGDGMKYEIRDPEPDENNNPGQTFKANYKEILLIPSKAEVPNLIQYAHGTKVLARYPETTTFYPAVVVGTKKDGKVRLKFDGEEEVNKETEVERRLVLPFPEK